MSRADVTSSIRQNLGLYNPNPNIKDIRSKGIGQLMVAVRNGYNEQLTEAMLKQWHTYLFLQKTKITVGDWRSHEAPMQVISGRIDKPTVHFEAPPSSDVPTLMAVFIDWFNDTAPQSNNPIMHAPIRAAISHIFFESIHPFEDGNGRIGRAIADKALSQSVGYPLMLSLSVTIERNKSAYYSALEQGQKSNEITHWIQYFVQLIIDAQQDAESTIQFTLLKSRFFDQYRTQLNQRQLKSINRMFQEGPKGFEGGMTTKKHISINSTSKASATRDLQALERIGAILVKGKGRNTHYFLNFSDL